MRDEGVAFDIEERNLGTCAVAAPIRDQMGNVIGSIGVIVPDGPVRARRARRRACSAVKRAAAALSGFLGYAEAEPRSRLSQGSSAPRPPDPRRRPRRFSSDLVTRSSHLNGIRTVRAVPID